MTIRVMHVVPDLGIGGAERMVVTLLENLDRSLVHPAVISLYGRQGTELEAALDALGVPVWYLGKTPGFSLSIFPRISQALNEFGPQVLHTHRYVLGYVLPFLMSRRSPRCVHTVHNVAEREVVTSVGRWVNSVAFRLGAVPVAIGDEVRASIRRVYGMENACTIRIGVPTKSYEVRGERRGAFRRDAGIDAGTVVYACVGRLSEQKNQEFLLRVFAKHLGGMQGALLLLVGDGPDRLRLEALAATLGVTGKVRFLGVRSDVADILDGTDVFVLASRWEGTPLSLMEAMAAGTAVVATRVGCIPEMLEDGVSGLLVPPQDEQALADAMVGLYSSAAWRERLAVAAKDRAQSEGGLERMTRKYEELYASVLATS